MTFARSAPDFDGLRGIFLEKGNETPAGLCIYCSSEIYRLNKPDDTCRAAVAMIKDKNKEKYTTCRQSLQEEKRRTCVNDDESNQGSSSGFPQ